MERESAGSSASEASVKQGPIGPLRPPKFAKVARALWPRKTAAHLAFHARVTERAAKRWLSGHRRPSAVAMRALIDEIFS